MPLTIWKFPIEEPSRFSLNLPEEARILDVQIQGAEPVLWALVDPELPLTVRHFQVYGTGWRINQAAGTLEHLGTFQLPGNGLAFHIFEDLSPRDRSHHA